MTEFHLARTLFEHIGRYGDRTAIRDRRATGWRELGWRDFGEQIRAVARGLLALGVREGEMVGIFSQNCAEWIVADCAILSLRGVSVPIYATNTPQQVEYVLDEAEIGVVFVGGQEQYERLLSLPGGPRLRRIVVFGESVELAGAKNAVRFSDFLAEGRQAGDDAKLDARLARASVDDLATLIYTSGTTGEPKGVMLHHANFQHAFTAHEERLDVSDRDESMCFLPLSHVFERVWTHFALHQGMVIHVCDDTTRIIECLQQARPTVMCSVPRFYEKIHATIFEKLETAPPLRQRLFRWAVGIGGQVFRLRNGRIPVPPLLRLKHRLADALVLRKIRAAVGGRIRFFPCGGAPLSKTIEEFFDAAGLTILCGYGLTETCATVTSHEHDRLRTGTVGKPLPGVQLRIGEAGEIQVQGKTVTAGYYRKPEVTAAAFTADGWLRTGDVGVIEDGFLSITDRIKDLIKTSGGKYVAPQLIENLIGNDHYIDQVCVVGDLRPYVTALVVPAFDALEEYARKNGIPFSSRAELIGNPEIVGFYEKRIGDSTGALARFETVKRFRLLARPFTQEDDELTPTLKLKRKNIHRRHHDLIEQMYA